MAHLGDQLSAYVDARLSPPVLYAWDRHVLVCPTCRQRVDEERRLLASLRAAPTPGVPTALQAMLLSLADGTALAGGAPTPARPADSPSPASATPPRLSAQRAAPPLPVLHRSLRRSIALAAVAAGASATAAWTLAMVQTPASMTSADASPVSATRPAAGPAGLVTARLAVVPAPSAAPVRASDGWTNAVVLANADR